LRLILQAEDGAARAVRLHRAAEMRTVVGDDREARDLLPTDGERAVVADEGGTTVDVTLRRIDVERRDVPLAFLVVGDGPHVDFVPLLAEERRQHREARDRDRDEAADDAAEAERRAFEELAAREALTGRGMRH